MCNFFVVRASTIDAGELTAMIGASAKIPVVERDRYDAVQAADLVWTASGTATLETALLTRPMVIVYRVSWLTYWIARLLVRVDHIGMVNLIAGKRLVPELIQGEVNPQRLIAESRRLLTDDKLRAGIIDELTRLRERLGSPGAADRVAAMATRHDGMKETERLRFNENLPPVVAVLEAVYLALFCAGDDLHGGVRRHRRRRSHFWCSRSWTMCSANAIKPC